MAPRAHARAGPSGAERWINCPPSVRLEEQFPDPGSVYANEGTFMHELAEWQLRQWLGRDGPAPPASPFHTPDIEEAVQEYCDYCMERINEARSRSKDAVVEIEQRVDLGKWIDGCFGTADLVIVSEGRIEVFDLKGGSNVAVSAVGNAQLRLYGLGAWDAWDALFDIQDIQMTIVQPRCGGVSTDQITAAELLDWAETVVKPAARLALAGEGELKAGEHCKWCRAQGPCRARAERNLELAKYDFQDPPLLSPQEIADILTRTDEFKRWVKGVEEYALGQALQGVEFDGFKLVAGRSNRQYTDEAAVAKTLLDQGYTADQVYKPQELLGITGLEKVLGKRKFQELLQDLVEKPPGKPTLAPADDKRPVWDNTSDFQ